MDRPIALGRRIGLDYGDRRIGIAVSDKESILVSPFATILNDENVLTKIEDLLVEVDPIYIVIGDPKHLSGVHSAKSKAARDFANTIRRKFSGPIYFVDERYSTSNSNIKLQEIGISEKSGRPIIDQIAAISILETAINNEKAGQPIGVVF